MTNTEWNKLTYYQKAWKLYLIMHYLNDESGYYSGWLYIWPDGETYEQCMEDFNDRVSYKELEHSFIYHYKDAHDGGLYSNKGVPLEVIKAAHFWDKKLRLQPIKVVK